MPKNHNNPPQEPDIVFRDDGQIHTEDGPVTHGTFWKKDEISNEEAREALAEVREIDPDQIALGEEISPELAEAARAGAALRRRMSVGFSKWNSSWDPHADRGDPSMN